MTTPTPIDRAILDDLIESIGDDGARTVIELFIGESKTYLAAIAEAAQPAADAASRDRGRRAAHSLKSSAGQLGATAMSAAAAAVEAAAGEAAADLTAVAAALQTQAEQSVAAFETLLRR